MMTKQTMTLPKKINRKMQRQALVDLMNAAEKFPAAYPDTAIMLIDRIARVTLDAMDIEWISWATLLESKNIQPQLTLVDNKYQLSNLAGILPVITEERIQGVVKRILSFKKLEDGWLNGEGLAPPPSELDWFAETFAKFYDSNLTMPMVYPTYEGNIQLEWENNKLELVICLKNHIAKWTGETKKPTLLLGFCSNWDTLNNIVRKYEHA